MFLQYSTRPTLLHDEQGFSLTELPIGILALLAIPRFMGVTTRAKMTEAKLALRQVHTLEQTYRYEFDPYAEDLAAIGYEPNVLVTEGGTARYLIEAIVALTLSVIVVGLVGSAYLFAVRAVSDWQTPSPSTTPPTSCTTG